MARERSIAAIFIPHEGCPYRCVFCNQTDITGAQGKADRERVEETLRAYFRSRPAASLPPRREAAFYGGSFTGLPLPRQEYLLALVRPWIESGEVHAIRLSTHPLFIDRQRLDLLKKYRVETVELGIQSTDPGTLKLSGRECSLETIRDAVGLIRENNFRLGLQLMPGLPGDSEAAFEKSVDDAIGWRPDFVRLYPALVVRHTPLHALYRDNKFVPWDLERTIEALKTAVLKFNAAGIRVARLGLHPDPALLENFVDGPYHPAMRYLVDSRICLDQMIDELRAAGTPPKSVVFKVPSRYVSNYTGHKRQNIQKLKEMFCLDEVRLQTGENMRRAELALR